MKQPVVNVTRLSGGGKLAVPVSGGAQVKWDIRRNREGWPTIDEGLALWSAYVAFESMRSGGLVDKGLSFDEFVDDIEKVEFASEKVEVDPTQQEISGGSAGS